MFHGLAGLIPSAVTEILVVLFLSFLLGLEREERKSVARGYAFGGVRTFPLLGLLGYALGTLSGQQWGLVAAGLAVAGAFLWLSYRHKLETQAVAGVTTELSGMVTYVIGVLVSRELLWIAMALAVLSMLLLELKSFLESLSQRVPADEILTFTKFLLLTFVILPVVPDRAFTTYQINPFKVWLVVVAVSSISYGSYILQKFTKAKGNVLLAALLGGAYSSTLTTVVLAKRARSESQPHLYAGGILIASGVMYLRFIVLVGLFNLGLMHEIALPFLILGVVAALGGWLWSRIPDAGDAGAQRDFAPKNPLELPVAFSFAVIFVGMLVATHFTLLHLGRGGIFALAGVMGVSDVDPFVMGLTQSAGTLTPLALAAAGLVIAAASNNLAKGFYAFFLAGGRCGRQALLLLAVLALVGLLPLVWIGLR
ncbi:MAG TPA: MgtC/SapB family protein [Methylomirabilota bacterium]|nr:MgtC/SapB family protein [Methylomirabilota bacterium]